MRLVVAAMVLACALPASAGVLTVGNRIAELDVAQGTDGKSFKLKPIKAKFLVVTVGASWCKPCKVELPAWDALAKELGDKVTFVAINLDNDSKLGEKFNAQLKLAHMMLAYLPADKSAVAARYGADTMPTTFVFVSGVLRYRKDGFENSDPGGERKRLRKALENLGAK